MNINNRVSYSETDRLRKLLNFALSLTVKNDNYANETDTPEYKSQGRDYIAAMKKTDDIYNYTFVNEDMNGPMGYSPIIIEIYRQYSTSTDRANALMKTDPEVRKIILNYKRKQRTDNFTEKCEYYNNLAGVPTNPEQAILIQHPIFPLLKKNLHEIDRYRDEELYKYVVDDQINLLDKLYEEYGYEYIKYFHIRIPIEVSRDARNFHIMYFKPNLLEHDELEDFFEYYYQSLDYILTTNYNSKWSSYQLYDGFMQVIILFVTINRYLTNRYKVYTRGGINETDIVAFFKSHRLESLLDVLPDAHLKTVVKNIDTLISYRGSAKILVDLPSIFGFDGIDIFKYVLMKDVKKDPFTLKPIINKGDPNNVITTELKFVQIPIGVENISKYLTDKQYHTEYNSLVDKDIYWGGINNTGINREKILTEIEDKLKTEEFSYMNTKYLSIVSAINVSSKIQEATYSIERALSSFSILEQEVDFDGMICSLREIVAMINIYICKKYKVADNTPLNIPISYALSTFDWLEALRQTRVSIKIGDGEREYAYIKDILDPEWIFILPVDEITSVNMERYNALIKKMYSTNDIFEYEALRKVYEVNDMSKQSLDTYGYFNTYTEYIQNNNLLLYNRMQLFDDSDEGIQNTLTSLISLFADSVTEDSDVYNAIVDVYRDNSIAQSVLLGIINTFKSFDTYIYEMGSYYTIRSYRNHLRVFDYIGGIERHSEGQVRLRDNLQHFIKGRITQHEEVEDIGFMKYILHKDSPITDMERILIEDYMTNETIQEWLSQLDIQQILHSESTRSDTEGLLVRDILTKIEE